MRPLLVFSPRYSVAIGDHVFPTRKFALTAELLKDAGDFIAPEEPSREELLLAHAPGWVDRVLSGRLSLDEEMRLELPFSPEVSLAHRLAVSGTILACRHALSRGVGLHVGGGSHHAFPDHGEGFCVLNDIACAVRACAVRAAVIDLDAHQGNGTAAIFSGDPEVFTFSMHQADLYPERKEGGSLDVELAAGTGDEEYLRRLKECLPRVFAFKPRLVVYQAGVDCAEGDLLGGLRLTAGGLRRRDESVRDACRKAGVPAAVTLGGGYSADLGRTASLHAQTLRVFAQGSDCENSQRAQSSSA